MQLLGSRRPCEAFQHLRHPLLQEASGPSWLTPSWGRSALRGDLQGLFLPTKAYARHLLCSRPWGSQGVPRLDNGLSLEEGRLRG